MICIPLIANDAEHFFIHLLAICISSFVKCLFSSLAHFLIGLFVFFSRDFFKFSVYSRYESSVRGVAGKNFLPFCRLSVEVSDSFLCCAEALQFNAIPHIDSLFNVLYLWGLVEEVFACACVEELD